MAHIRYPPCQTPQSIPPSARSSARPHVYSSSRLEIRPLLRPREIRVEFPGIDVGGINFDGLAHRGRGKDSDFPYESCAGSGCECAAGETEKVEFVAWDVVVDDKIEAVDDIFD